MHLTKDIDAKVAEVISICYVSYTDMAIQCVCVCVCMTSLNG